MGNRLSKTVNGVTTNYIYNNANMILTQGTNNYTNDASGNTLTGGAYEHLECGQPADPVRQERDDLDL